MTPPPDAPGLPTLIYLITEDWFFLSHFVERADAARKAGYRVVVATHDTGRSGEIRARGFGFASIDFRRRGLNPFHELKTIVEIRQLYRRERPALLHHVALKPIAYGALAAGDVPTVNAPVGMGYIYSSRWPTARLLRKAMALPLAFALRRAPSVTVFENRDDMRELIERKQVRKAQAIMIRGAGVDVEAIVPTAEADAPIRVVMISRMLWSKGVGDFVTAAGLVKASRPKTAFVLVGAPDPQNPDSVSEEQLLQWHREGVIEWLGFRSDIADILAASHVACLPSFYGEGLPKTLLEAMAAGRSIVTTDIPGCREAVEDGVNGLLVAPRNPELLADALGKLVDGPALRRQMGEAGRRRAEREFSSSKVVAETLSLYERTAFRSA
jgi:glycosyltransferase involved in cell wall biosynthesis